MEKIITNYLIKNGNAVEEEREIIEFGIKQGVISMLSWASIILSGALIGVFWEGLLFCIAFSQVRKYAGGYHLRSQLACYFFSLISVFSTFLIIKYVTFNNLAMLVLWAVAFVIIYKLSPIGDENKELDDDEIDVYRKLARRNLIIESIIASILFFAKLNVFFNCIILAFVYLAINLTAAVIKNNRK